MGGTCRYCDKEATREKWRDGWLESYCQAHFQFQLDLERKVPPVVCCICMERMPGGVVFQGRHWHQKCWEEYFDQVEKGEEVTYKK